MKSILLILLSVISLGAVAQKISYADWQEESKHNISLLPKYGGAEKTVEQLAADSVFIATATQKTTAHDASNYFVKVGFDLLAKGDQKTAMFRFNQAWLLDPKNENVYWGFGGVYFSFNDHENALVQYTEGLVLNPKSANIMIDMATIGMARYYKNKDINELAASINLLKLAYEIDPNKQNLLFKLSACYFLKDDCTSAIKYYDECVKLGGQVIPESFKKAISEKCKIN
jgi:tetratricopeptide (TPR) repeat protein